MDLIVKKASYLTTEEKTALGITGIPANWPVETYPYEGSIPAGFELMTDTELALLKSNNQAAYDAWIASKVQTVQAPAQQVTLTSLPESLPFALPTYRTKRDATNILTVNPGTSNVMDYLVTEERYVSGGELITENAEFGDYISASVHDTDSVIPAPYRAALCEAWPIVATYVIKRYVSVRTPGSIQAGSVTENTINTFPLNAKITAGLHLRFTYFATNTGLDRRIVINYHLTKKL